MNQWQCRHCGILNSEHNNECRICGNQNTILLLGVLVIFCRRCSAKNVDRERCWNCKRRL